MKYSQIKKITYFLRSSDDSNSDSYESESELDTTMKTDPIDPQSEMDIENFETGKSLPTNQDIYNEIASRKKEHKICVSKVMVEIIKVVALSLISLWDELGIPTLKYQYVQRDLRELEKKGPNKFSMDDICYIAKCRCFLKAKKRTITTIGKNLHNKTNPSNMFIVNSLRKWDKKYDSCGI